MRARLFRASIVVFGTMPLFLATFAACGDDTGDGAFGGGGGGSSTATTTATSSTGLGVTASSAASTSQVSSGGEGGAGGDGGAAEGGGGSGEGGGGGAGGTGGTGGAGPVDVACENGCVPFPSDGAGGGGAGGADDDCDDDGDPNPDDCQPCNPDVFHGQAAYFANAFESFEGGGEPSFDYDCSGGAEYEHMRSEDGCGAYTADTCPEDEPVYTSDDVVCGEAADLQNCEVSGSLVGIAGSCVNDGAASSQSVRCH